MRHTFSMQYSSFAVVFFNSAVFFWLRQKREAVRIGPFISDQILLLSI